MSARSSIVAFHAAAVRCAVVLLASLLLPMARASGQPVPGLASGRLVSARVTAASLAGNLVGDPVEQRVDVYLPPSYDRDVSRRYPVVYLLHGFLGSPDDFVKPTFQGMTVQGAMDSLIAMRGLREMIVVVPNGRNRYGGSMFTNSPVTGAWADYLTRDLVGWVDGHYRTVASPAGRGVAGHSMGGYAALVLAMRHPELFGAVYAMSPCCIDVPPEFGPSNPLWAKARAASSVDDLWRMLQAGDPWPIHALAALAAWAPDPARAPLYVTWPAVAHGTFDSSFVAAWRAQLPVGMLDTHVGGRVDGHVDAYVAALRGLRGLRFDAGTADQYPHIPTTTRALSQRLAALGVPHGYELYDGDHRNRLGRRMSAVVLPFFADVLQDGRDGVPVSSPGATSATRGGTSSPQPLVIYLPSRSVDLLGVDSVGRLDGSQRVDVRGIMQGLERRGARVTLRTRALRSMWDAADSVAADVAHVIEGGTPVEQVTLLGHGRGGTIALIAAAKLGLPALRVVVLAPCTPDMLQNVRGRPETVRLSGRILVLRTSGDHETESCRPLFTHVSAPSSVEEVVLPSDRGIEEFSMPRDAWMDAVVRWLAGQPPG